MGQWYKLSYNMTNQGEIALRRALQDFTLGDDNTADVKKRLSEMKEMDESRQFTVKEQIAFLERVLATV